MTPIQATTPVAQLIGAVARSAGTLPVVEESGECLGVISQASLLEVLNRERERTHG